MSRSQRGAAVLNVLLSFAAFATVAYGIYEIIPTNAASQTAAAVLTESTTEGATASSKIGLQGPKQCDAPLEEKDQAPTDTVSTESKPEDEGLKKECVPGCLYRVQASGDVIATDLCALSTKEASAECAKKMGCVVQQPDASGGWVNMKAASGDARSLDAFMGSRTTAAVTASIRESPDLQAALASGTQEAFNKLSPQLQEAFKAQQPEVIQQNKAKIESYEDAIRELGESNSTEVKKIEAEIERLQRQNQRLASITAVGPGEVGTLTPPTDTASKPPVQNGHDMPPSAGSTFTPSTPREGGNTLRDAIRRAAFETQTTNKINEQIGALSADLPVPKFPTRTSTDKEYRAALPPPPEDLPTSDRDWATRQGQNVGKPDLTNSTPHTAPAPDSSDVPPPAQHDAKKSDAEVPCSPNNQECAAGTDTSAGASKQAPVVGADPKSGLSNVYPDPNEAVGEPRNVGAPTPAPAPRPDGKPPAEIGEQDGICFALASNSSEHLYLTNRGYRCDATGLGSYSCSMTKGRGGCAPPFNPAPVQPAPQAPRPTTQAPAPQTQQQPAVTQQGGGAQTTPATPPTTAPETPPLTQKMPFTDSQGNICARDPFANQIDCKLVKPVPLPWQSKNPITPTPAPTNQKDPNQLNYPDWQGSAPAAIEQRAGQCYAVASNNNQQLYLSVRGYTCWAGPFPMACFKTDPGTINGCARP